MLMTMLLMALGALDGWRPLLILVSIAIVAGLWLAAFVDIIRSRFKSSTSKLVWLFIVTFAPVVGVLLYILLGRQQRIL